MLGFASRWSFLAYRVWSLECDMKLTCIWKMTVSLSVGCGWGRSTWSENSGSFAFFKILICFCLYKLYHFFVLLYVKIIFFLVLANALFFILISEKIHSNWNWYLKYLSGLNMSVVFVNISNFVFSFSKYFLILINFFIYIFDLSCNLTTVLTI